MQCGHTTCTSCHSLWLQPSQQKLVSLTTNKKSKTGVTLTTETPIQSDLEKFDIKKLQQTCLQTTINILNKKTRFALSSKSKLFLFQKPCKSPFGISAPHAIEDQTQAHKLQTNSGNNPAQSMS